MCPALVAATGPAPHPQWIEVDRPYPAFELAMPELAAIPANYAIRRRAADGARKDVLTWGTAAEPGPFVSVEIYRSGDRTEPFIDPDSEIAARIVPYTVTDDVKPAGRIDSKFGTVPLVDFAIATRGLQRRCLGFARPSRNPRCRSPAGIAVRAKRWSIGRRWPACSTGSPSYRPAAIPGSMPCSPAPRSSALSAAAAIRSLQPRQSVPDRYRGGMADRSRHIGLRETIQLR